MKKAVHQLYRCNRQSAWSIIDFTRGRQVSVKRTFLLQEFRRLQAALGAARDRVDLFAGSSDSSPLQVNFAQAVCFILVQVKRTIIILTRCTIRADLAGCRPQAQDCCSESEGTCRIATLRCVSTFAHGFVLFSTNHDELVLQ